MTYLNSSQIYRVNEVKKWLTAILDDAVQNRKNYPEDFYRNVYQQLQNIPELSVNRDIIGETLPLAININEYYCWYEPTSKVLRVQYAIKLRNIRKQNNQWDIYTLVGHEPEWEKVEAEITHKGKKLGMKSTEVSSLLIWLRNIVQKTKLIG